MENARIMREGLTELGLTVYGGANEPYLWVKTPNNAPSWKFFEDMLYGAQVVCTPGVDSDKLVRDSSDLLVSVIVKIALRP